jgi:hypothetical protein
MSTEPDVDGTEPACSLEEFGVDERLDEPVPPQPAEFGGTRVEFGRQPAAAVHEPQDLVRDGVPADLVDERCLLEGAEALHPPDAG